MGEAIKKQSAANEFRLIQKYKGVLFFDDDTDDDESGDGKVFKIIESNVEWKKKDKNDKETPCYCVLAKPSIVMLMTQIWSHFISMRNYVK